MREAHPHSHSSRYKFLKETPGCASFFIFHPSFTHQHHSTISSGRCNFYEHYEHHAYMMLFMLYLFMIRCQDSDSCLDHGPHTVSEQSAVWRLKTPVTHMLTGRRRGAESDCHIHLFSHRESAGWVGELQREMVETRFITLFTFTNGRERKNTKKETWKQRRWGKLGRKVDEM